MLEHFRGSLVVSAHNFRVECCQFQACLGISLEDSPGSYSRWHPDLLGKVKDMGKLGTASHILSEMLSTTSVRLLDPLRYLW